MIGIRYIWGDEVKQVEPDAVCCKREGKQKCLQGFSGDTSGKDTTQKIQATQYFDIKRGLKKQDQRMWTGLFWLRTEIDGDHENGTFGSHKMWTAQQLSVFKKNCASWNFFYLLVYE